MRVSKLPEDGQKEASTMSPNLGKKLEAYSTPKLFHKSNSPNYDPLFIPEFRESKCSCNTPISKKMYILKISPTSKTQPLKTLR